jgi:hypothetical protein
MLKPGRKQSMNDTQPRLQDDLKGRAPEDEWEGIINRIEQAIVITMANKVLENATLREKQIEERRRKLKLIELKRYPRRRRQAGMTYE